MFCVMYMNKVIVTFTHVNFMTKSYQDMNPHQLYTVDQFLLLDMLSLHLPDML